MAYENKDGEGALFKNDDKKTEQHPDYRGNLKLNGQDFYVSAWIKSSKDGKKKYMSLSVKPKQQREAPPQDSAPFDDSIPF